jgi:hypothetical protein
VFELWDTRNSRLVGTFPSESDALDAAYRELRAPARAGELEHARRPQLAVWSAANRAVVRAVTAERRSRLSGAIMRAIAPVRSLSFFA